MSDIFSPDSEATKVYRELLAEKGIELTLEQTSEKLHRMYRNIHDELESRGYNTPLNELVLIMTHPEVCEAFRRLDDWVEAIIEVVDRRRSSR